MNPFDNAMSQLEKAAKIINLDKNILSFLSYPERTITANLMIKMDKGDLRTFSAYRVQYNSACGPYKGGIRFHPQVNLEEVKALAFWMTIKTALVNIPMGGGKGGVVVDTKSLSEKEVERIARSWIRAFRDVIGPKKDIPAPDIYTNPKIMSYMVDEYSKLVNRPSLGVVTGKPLEKGGSKGRGSATAQGGFYVLEEVLKERKLNHKPSIAIQGFGNAGSIIAKLLYAAGYKVVALADSKGAFYDKKGINIEKVLEYKEENKTLKGFAMAKEIEQEELLKLNIDILIPAALENQINKDNVESIKAKIILELANGPTTFEAEKILNKKEVIIIPDVLANSGGVIVSYFEWLQNLKDKYWTEEGVNSKLREKIIKAWQETSRVAKKHNTNLRTAAFIVALERIKEKVNNKS